MSFKVHKRGDTLFVALPPGATVAILQGCQCAFCKANPDKTPSWDTLAIDPESERAWTVHFPELDQ